ncbi:hypothetical protein [Aidingimonas lacisalsi]|uniref:hypothetical protein n=1 Tax=Aidingimonas lacisalsi TaxID=2604086 RepID=UPI0011D2AC9E|nr:hypothetical protein [Aidingimonas lacisalsi]
MIDIKSASSEYPVEFPDKFSHGFVGAGIDDRTNASVEHVHDSCENVFVLEYDGENLNIKVDGIAVECHDFPEFFSSLSANSIIVDSTSLDIPELAILLKSAINEAGLEIFFIYFEPSDYSVVNNGALTLEDFGLSDRIIGFEGAGIPTLSMPVEGEVPRKFVFFVGYEAGRLQSAIETYDIMSDEAKIFFGMPAFRPGWEVKSIKRSLPVLSEQSITGSSGYCSASNARDALRVLREFDNYKEEFLMYVLPLGTKPCSIAAILFSLENEGRARLLYDQPGKKSGRSYGVGRKHYYRCLLK